MLDQNISVVVRIRKKDSTKQEVLSKNNNQIYDSQKNAYHSFDIVFNHLNKQDDIYHEIGTKIIKSVFSGYNCCVFAYGQTGCFLSGTKIKMLNNTEKPVETIKVGDKLLGDDLKCRNVLKLYSGIEPMYDINNEYVVNLSHIMVLFYNNSIIEIPVYKLINSEEVFYLVKIINNKITKGDKLIITKHSDINYYYGFEVDGNNRFIGAGNNVLRNSGKTHTMNGENSDGIIPKLIRDIYDLQKNNNIEYKVELQYIEIYAEKVFDLLNNTSKSYNVRMHPNFGGYVDGLDLRAVADYDTFLALLMIGNQNRKTSETKMNRNSSRSHAIAIVQLTQILEVDGRKKELVSRINLVDLAGSENVNQSCVTGIRLQEAIQINKSLSSLLGVINALNRVQVSRTPVTVLNSPKFIKSNITPTIKRTSSSTSIVSPKRSNSSTSISIKRTISSTSNTPTNHIPYRDSILTQLLFSSLGGNSKTVMIATITSDLSNYRDSINTIKYAGLVKNIKNKPIINENDTDKLIVKLQNEINDLKEKLNTATVQGSPTSTIKMLREELQFREYTIQTRDKTWQERLDESKKEFDNMVLSLEQQRIHNKQLQNQIELLKKESDNRKELIDQSNKEIKSYFDEKIVNNDYDKKLLLDMKEKLSEELNNLKNSLSEMLKKDENYQQIISSLKKENSELKLKINSLNEERKNYLRQLHLISSNNIYNERI